MYQLLLHGTRHLAAVLTKAIAKLDHSYLTDILITRICNAKQINYIFANGKFHKYECIRNIFYDILFSDFPIVFDFIKWNLGIWFTCPVPLGVRLTNH